jgi:hypothetical protein
VLTERSLPDALAALAADCPVPCRIDADLPGRCAPASPAGGPTTLTVSLPCGL